MGAVGVNMPMGGFMGRDTGLFCADPVITWRTPLQGPLRLRLFDAAGREVIAHSRTDAPVRSVQLPWKDKLASGTYLLRVDAMDRTFTFNVIIQ